MASSSDWTWHCVCSFGFACFSGDVLGLPAKSTLFSNYLVIGGCPEPSAPSCRLVEYNAQPQIYVEMEENLTGHKLELSQIIEHLKGSTLNISYFMNLHLWSLVAFGTQRERSVSLAPLDLGSVKFLGAFIIVAQADFLQEGLGSGQVNWRVGVLSRGMLLGSEVGIYLFSYKKAISAGSGSLVAKFCFLGPPWRPHYLLLQLFPVQGAWDNERQPHIFLIVFDSRASDGNVCSH